MPRLNIDESVWPKIDLLAIRLKWRHQDVLSSLVYLWRNTQQLEMIYCSRDDIARFCRLRSANKVDDFISACSQPDVKLLTAHSQPMNSLCIACSQSINRLCIAHSQPMYRISGNEKHVRAINDYKERGKLGGRPPKEKAIALEKQNPLHNNTIHNNTYINPPIIGESSNLEQIGGKGDDEKTLTDLVAYAENKLGVTATKPQIEKFKKEAANLDPKILKQDIDWIANHPKASKESKSITRAFHAAEVRLAMSEWDKRLKIEIRGLIQRGNKPSEVVEILKQSLPNFDHEKLAQYAQKIIRGKT